MVVSGASEQLALAILGGGVLAIVVILVLVATGIVRQCFDAISHRCCKKRPREDILLSQGLLDHQPDAEEEKDDDDVVFLINETPLEIMENELDELEKQRTIKTEKKD